MNSIVDQESLHERGELIDLKVVNHDIYIEAMKLLVHSISHRVSQLFLSNYREIVRANYHLMSSESEEIRCTFYVAFINITFFPDMISHLIGFVYRIISNSLEKVKIHTNIFQFRLLLNI